MIRTPGSRKYKGEQGLYLERGKCHRQHLFICLDKMDADRVPTTQSAKMALEEAGLGEKVMEEPDMDRGPEEFNAVVLSAYPKFKEGGGYEMLRCKPASRDLVITGLRVANTPKHLKRRVGSSEVYLWPLQRDLSLDIDEEDCDDVKGVNIMTIVSSALVPFPGAEWGLCG